MTNSHETLSRRALFAKVLRRSTLLSAGAVVLAAVGGSAAAALSECGRRELDNARFEPFPPTPQPNSPNPLTPNRKP